MVGANKGTSMTCSGASPSISIKFWKAPSPRTYPSTNQRSSSSSSTWKPPSRSAWWFHPMCWRERIGWFA